MSAKITVMRSFVRSQSGAVTADMVVLMASVVMLAFAVSGTIHDGLIQLLDDVSTALGAISFVGF